MNSKHVRTMVWNQIMTRSALMRQWTDKRRDLDDECGYPRTEEISDSQYRLMYDREPIAARVVQVLPDESWQVQPLVYEDEDTERVTAFEEAWDHLAVSLRGKSWYLQEEGNPIWEYLCRADILSGIGCFGILLLGIDDGKELSEPIDGMDREGMPKGHSKVTRELVFLRAFDKSCVEIAAYETDRMNRRYMQPISYNIKLNNAEEAGIGLNVETVNVHWTRVIHIADNCNSSDIFGVPRMQPVFNRLCDLRKLYGGSAEMYWKGAFPGMVFEADPSLAGEVDFDTDTMKAMLEEYTNGLQRYLALVGASARMLSPTVVDPTPQVTTQIQAICIKLGIPQRIFMGSERGELASSQDERAWNARLIKRRTTYVTPRIIVPFVDRLIGIGVLPEPKEFIVEWPKAYKMTEAEISSVAIQQTDALSKYIGGNVETMIPPLDYMVRILKMDEEEATSILDNATKHLEESNPEAEGPVLPGHLPKQPTETPIKAEAPEPKQEPVEPKPK